MKNLLAISIFMLVLAGCKKDITIQSEVDGKLDYIKDYLRDSLSKKDWTNLDFENIKLLQYKESKKNYLRIPFTITDAYSDFIVVELNSKEEISSAKIVTITKESPTGPGSISGFNGHITISYLNRETTVNSVIVNGFIKAFHELAFESSRNTILVVPGPKDSPPEILTAEEPSGATSTWINLLIFSATFLKDRLLATIIYRSTT